MKLEKKWMEIVNQFYSNISGNVKHKLLFNILHVSEYFEEVFSKTHVS